MSDVPELIEKIARAISAFKGRDPDACVFGYGLDADGNIPCMRRGWEDEVSEAQAVFEAIKPFTVPGDVS